MLNGKKLFLSLLGGSLIVSNGGTEEQNPTERNFAPSR